MRHRDRRGREKKKPKKRGIQQTSRPGWLAREDKKGTEAQEKGAGASEPRLSSHLRM